MITKNEIKVTGSTYSLSLSKLVGKQIADVTFYVSHFDEDTPVIRLCQIVFDDGSEMDIEGEHDMPYATTYTKWPMPNTDDETLEELAKEE